MRLITHNMLRNNAKGVEGGYPLRLEVKSESGSITREESEFDAERVKCLLKKLNFGALKSVAKDLSMESELEGVEAPLTDESLEDMAFLQAAHKLLFEVNVVEGSLVCPESGRVFPIREGIPNMLLHEDEV